MKIKNLFFIFHLIIVLFFLTSKGVAEDKVKFEKKMKQQYKKYTKTMEWTDTNTFTTTLNRSFSNAELKSTLRSSCKLAKKNKLLGITIQIKSSNGKLLQEKNC